MVLNVNWFISYKRKGRMYTQMVWVSVGWWLCSKGRVDVIKLLEVEISLSTHNTLTFFFSQHSHLYPKSSWFPKPSSYSQLTQFYLLLFHLQPQHFYIKPIQYKIKKLWYLCNYIIEFSILSVEITCNQIL